MPDPAIDNPADPPAEPPAAAPTHTRRIALLALLLIVAIAFACFWYLTPTGKAWRHEHAIAHWMEAHRLLAPLGVVAIYLLMGTLAMPVWWLQLLAGRTLGLVEGIVVCQTAATLSAALTAWLAQWSASDFLTVRVEQSMKKLRALEAKLGHNGLLVVMATRLVHVVPFGLSNYLFGLLRIRVRAVLVGTLLGNLPAVCWLVGAGSFLRGGVHLGLDLADLREHASFFIWLAVLNIALLGLLRLRYVRPQWFAKIGIE
jgi:uncharacterized membrane protein YdjX (TVP38/TMEM64 family)